MVVLLQMTICILQDAHACLRALNLSKTLDEPTKENTLPVLIADIYLQISQKLILPLHESSDNENKAASVWEEDAIGIGLPGDRLNRQQVISGI